MHLVKLLHKTFKKELPFIHKLRLKNLMDASSTLLRVNKLTLTALGRHFPRAIKKCTAILSMVYLGREALNKGINRGAKQFKKILQLLFDINNAAQLENALNH